MEGSYSNGSFPRSGAGSPASRSARVVTGAEGPKGSKGMEDGRSRSRGRGGGRRGGDDGVDGVYI